jgi:SPP1 gp7 family putative phage head morphogenesis protein
MQRKPYQKADEAVARITSKICKEFRHNRLALFDELNIVGVKKHVHKLYQNVYKVIKREFDAILNPLYQEIYEEALAMGFDGDLRDLDEAWIEDFFDEYNPVTKYVFSNEMERKESRLFESLVATMDSTSAAKMQSYKTAENLLIRQVKQYAIDLEDSIAKVVYEDAGVKKVMWVAEKDHKTCGECMEMDGEVFGLKDAPPKLHHNCRCYYIPVKE